MPNRIGKLKGLIMNFRTPVYSTPHARVVDDGTVVGGIGMSLTQGLSGDGFIEKNGCVRYSRITTMESACGEPIVSELKARVVAMKSKLALITQILVEMSGSLGEITLSDQVQGRTRMETCILHKWVDSL